MDSDWLSRTTWLGLDWSLAYWEVNNVSLMMAKAVSPLTVCTPLHTGRLMFFLTPVYMNMIMKIVHICVQYVLIVCLNVLSTLFSYFSLT